MYDINNTNDPQKKYRLETVSKNILLEGLKFDFEPLPYKNLWEQNSTFFF